MADNAAMIARNAERWNKAHQTRGNETASVAKRLVAAKTRYQAVALKTGVPWFVIAVAHERESSQRWDRSLAQGDPWNQVSTHVPRGRGPFSSWEEAAIDALAVCKPYAAKWKDWSVGGTLTILELYNGKGYFNGPVTKDSAGNVIARYPSQPSPYVWSGTDQYRSGKYVADGIFDPDVVDKQLGCAALIMAMMALDPSIKFGGIAAVQPPVMPIPDVPKPEPAPPKQGLVAAILSLLASIFKR